MAYTYDSQNIFARILRGEIPNSTVRETEHTLAFRDIAPQAPEHILVIPKGEYVTADHFAAARTRGNEKAPRRVPVFPGSMALGQ